MLTQQFSQTWDNSLKGCGKNPWKIVLYTGNSKTILKCFQTWKIWHEINFTCRKLSKFRAVKKTLNFRGLCTCRDKALPSSVKTIFKFTFIYNIRNPLQPSKICRIETQNLTFSFTTSRGLLKGFTLKSLRDHFPHTSMQWAN